MHKQVLEIYKSHFGEDKDSLNDAVINLAEFLKDINDYVGA